MYQPLDTLPEEQSVHTIQRRVLSFRAPPVFVSRLGEVEPNVLQETKSGWNRQPVKQSTI